MKKSNYFIIITLIFAFSMLFCGCSHNNSDIKAENGAIIIECDGLSAYEIFCKHYIYIDSEKQWIDDLIEGKLERVDNSVLEEKILWNGSIEDDFEDNKIILTVDKYFYDKTFTVDDFHMIEAEEVKLINNYSTESSPGDQIYVITINNVGKINVIKSIRKLEIFAFTKQATPNLIDTTT